MRLLNKSVVLIQRLFLLLLSLNCSTSFARAANCSPLDNNIISSPGCYYLSRNIVGSIIINSDSVVLDLNKMKIIDPNPGSQNIGIRLSSYSNITIENGYMDGFWFAISGSGGNNINIFKINFTNTRYIAINLSGSKINVIGNYISNMDFYQPKNAVDYYLVGLNIRDTFGCRISNNVILAPYLPTEELGYRLEYVGLILSSTSQNCLIQNNIFSNFQSPLFESIAVWLGSESMNSFLSDNLILNYRYGIAGTLGSYSEKNNLSVNVETPQLSQRLDPPTFDNNDKLI